MYDAMRKAGDPRLKLSSDDAEHPKTQASSDPLPEPKTLPATMQPREHDEREIHTEYEPEDAMIKEVTGDESVEQIL